MTLTLEGGSIPSLRHGCAKIAEKAKAKDLRHDLHYSHFAKSRRGTGYRRRMCRRQALADAHDVDAERLTDNALIARKFRALGFSKVRVSGAGAVRRVEGVWARKDASATLPRQIVAVARL